MENQNSNSFSQYALLGNKKKNFQLLNSITKAVIVLNLFDSLLTLLWVRIGVAEEANILLRSLVSQNAVLFMCVKVALVSLGSSLLWRYRRHLLAELGIFLVFFVYSGVLLYHMHFLHLLV